MFKWMTLPVLTLILSLGMTAYAGKQSKSLNGVINLNQASSQQLQMLPGIGEKTADAIIAYRQKTKFSRPEDIVQVKGLGKKKFEKFKAYLAVSGPTTLTEGGAAPPRATAQGRTPPAKH